MRNVLFLLSLVALTVSAQQPLVPEWIKIVQPPIEEAAEAWSVDVGSDGYIYWAVNQTTINLTKDLTVYKLDENANEIWPSYSVYTSTMTEQSYIIREAQGVVYTGGRICDCGDPNLTCCDLLLVAMSASNGDTLWSKRYDVHGEYEECDGLIIDGDSLIVTGWTREANADWFDVLLMKTDLNGNIGWQYTWDEGLNKDERQDGHIFMDDSCLYMSGISHGIPSTLTLASGLDGQATLWKFSKEGIYKDHVTWGYDGPWIDFDDALGMTATDSALFAVGIVSPAGNNSDWFIRRYDKDLQLVWEDEFGGLAGEAGRAIDVDADGNLWALCNTSSFNAGTEDIGLLKYSPDGQMLGFWLYETPGDETAQDIKYYNNTLYISGSTNNTVSGKEHAILLKINMDSLLQLTPIEGYTVLDFTIYPNPAQEHILIEGIVDPFEAISVRITNSTGQIIFNELEVAMQGEAIRIDLDKSVFTHGVYYLQLSSGKHSKTKPFAVD